MLTIRLASETREVITETQIVVLLLTLALFALVLFGAIISVPLKWDELNN